MNIKRAQEEMVGFALILVVVAVILLIFLAFSVRDSGKENVESYEVDSFIQSMLQYTTDCRDFLEPLSVQKVISECSRGSVCVDGANSCEVLNSTLTGLLEESWPVGNERPVKGYELIINSGEKSLFNTKKGNETVNSKGAAQFFQDTEIIFTAYY